MKRLELEVTAQKCLNWEGGKAGVRAGAREFRVESLGKKQGCKWGDNEEVQKKKKLGNEDRLNIGD